MNFMNRLNNPLTQLGINILGADSVGKGLQTGLASIQQQQRLDKEDQWKRQQGEIQNQLAQLRMQKLQKEIDTPAERKMYTDVNGFKRFVDTNERLNEGLVKAETAASTLAKFKLAQAQAEEARRLKQVRLLGNPEVSTSSPHEQDLFPGEAPVPGLYDKEVTSPATGMYSDDPVVAKNARLQAAALSSKPMEMISKLDAAGKPGASKGFGGTVHFDEEGNAFLVNKDIGEVKKLPEKIQKPVTVLDTNGRLIAVNPVTGETVRSEPKVLAPKDEPNHIEAVEAAKIEGQGKITPAEKKYNAKSGVSDQLDTLTEHYLTLQDSGGIVDTSKDAGGNISARIRSSGVGQFIEGAVGSEDQSTRNKIDSLRPLLINNIRQASEMGARGLDSEKELAFYLQAVTDTSRDVQSNLAAIEVLRKAYGLGGGHVKIPPRIMAELKAEAKAAQTTQTTPPNSGYTPDDFAKEDARRAAMKQECMR